MKTEKENEKMKKEVWISIVIGVIIFIIIFTSLNIYSSYKHKEICYEEAFELWGSVNENYPYVMGSQESYDKNNRQACASFYYVACIHGDKVICAKTNKEKLNEREFRE